MDLTIIVPIIVNLVVMHGHGNGSGSGGHVWSLQS